MKLNLNQFNQIVNIGFYVILAIAVATFAGIYYYTKNAPKGQKKNKKKSLEEVKKDSVFNFLGFDKVQDDMIIQDNGSQYTMVVECQGINYDLMSEAEKISIEEGFVQFLNAVKFPVQFYIQTRTVDLEESIGNYKKRMSDLEETIMKLVDEYKIIEKSANPNIEKLLQVGYDIQKKQNVLEYGRDITLNIERISVNKVILQRRYYIVVSYHTSELGLTNSYNQEELLDMAYSELYTRARSVCNALLSCNIDSRILDSNELAELLYIGYNRDDAENYSVKKALESGFYRLYSTSKDTVIKREELKQKLEEQIKQQQAYDEAAVTNQQ